MKAVSYSDGKVFPSIMYGSTSGIKDFEVAAKLISTSPTIGDTIITHRFPLQEAEEAFNVAQDKSSNCIKVVFDPNS